MNTLLMELVPWIREGYCCSQLLVLLALQAQGRENTPLVRAMQGLCQGIGESGGPCGLLTGGACVLGLWAGHGGSAEEAHELFTPLLNDYGTWFAERTAGCGGPSCSALLASGGQPLPLGGVPYTALCGELMADCWGKLLDLAESYNIDITEAR